MSPPISPPTLVVVLLAASFASAAEPFPNTWVKLDKAAVEGRRHDVPLGYSLDLKRFLVLGGRSNFDDYKKPRSYDELALDLKEGEWENWFPAGKDWGPRFGPCRAPGWKNETFGFKDVEGNVRPNWTVYGTFSLGQKYDYDSDDKCFYFYAGGHTFRYDPAARKWVDLAPKTDPEKELGGVLLWSSMCYDRRNKQFLLFGGGNIQSERGDPGTWTYSPTDNAWTQLVLDKQPPARANSRLVYDPVHRKAVLFGGDRLDQLQSDTWTFDVVARKWEEKKPERCPSPRAGQAMLWLPKARKVLLLGGYGYTSTTEYMASLYRQLPFEAWTYDAEADRWELLKRWQRRRRPASPPQGPMNAFLPAAVDEDDVVVALGDDGTWTCRIDATQTDAADTLTIGVKPGAVERRTGSYDPAWYKEGVPAADPAKVEADLKDLKPNEWALRPTPRAPGMNMDWGSAAFAPDADAIVRFSGGHCAYSGTAPLVYDVKTDRYSLPFAPELPLEFIYSNDQVGGEWTFQGNPWMACHTYKTTGYDPNLKRLVFAAHDFTYFFDPTTGKWSRNGEQNPFRRNCFVVTLCATPKGVVAWADKRDHDAAGLWRLDPEKQTWQPLTLTGRLPAKSPDRHGMAYDSKRDRLLFFSDADKDKGDATAYDLQTGEAKSLNAAGKDKAAAPSRETVYIPEADAVLVGARVHADDKLCWLLYDCGKNAWFGVELPGADPIGKGTGSDAFNNSMGLMYDPNRGLVWAVGQYSDVHVLRFDLKSAKIHELK